jgi:hypothetical protein
MMDILNLPSRLLLSFAGLLVEFLGPGIVASVRYCFGLSHRFILIDIHFKHWVFPMWQFISFSIVAIFIGCQLERKVRAEKNRVRNDFSKMFDAKKTLSATAIAEQGRQTVSAIVESIGSSYKLDVATESTNQPKTSEQHHFTTLSDFLHFLEKKTILRAGDFK